MRIKIGDKVYPTVARDEISLRDLMLFNTQAEEFGVTWGDVEQVMGEWEGLTEEQAERHPQKFLVIGVTLWMSRRAAGEDVTFSEAVDVNLADVDFLPEPQDKSPGKAKAAKKKAPKASGLVAAPQPDADREQTSAPQDSEKRSIPA